MARSIVVDMNRCTGCWTCSMACKTAFDLDKDEFWQYIRTIGSGEIDQPGGKWPNLYLKWQPIWKQSCRNCTGDASTEDQPFCVFNCPTGALFYGELTDPTSAASQRVEELRQRGYRLFEIPAWEDTRENILYMERSQ